MSKKLWIIGVLAVLGLLGQACAPKNTPQASCNFVMSADAQRVSWGPQVPVTLYLDASVPTEYIPAIRSAIKKWNDVSGRELLQLGGWTTGYPSESQDGVNVIYFTSNWADDMASREKQAITTVYWAGDRIFEADVRVNVKNFGYSASAVPVAGKVDIESLMLHEFGHVLGFEHSEIGGTVMAKRLDNGTPRREPAPVDIEDLKCEYQ